MNKSTIYNYQFLIKKVSDRPIPLIKTGGDAFGMNIHAEMASFIKGCDIEQSEEIINEIIGLNLTGGGSTIVDYQIDGGYDDIIEISAPGTVSFPDTNGGTIDYPVDDFLGILQEWVDFLKSIPH